MKYVNLVINNRSDSTDAIYTYGCRDDRVKPGSKVLVPFAKGNRLREAYVVSVDEDAPDKIKKKLKYVHETDEEISLTDEMVRTSLWLRERCLCRYIDAIKCFLPAGKKAVRKARKDPFECREGETGNVRELTDQQREALKKIEEPVESGRHGRFSYTALPAAARRRYIYGQRKRSYQKGAAL